MYEEPQADYNYEPPPCERVFTPPRVIKYTGGDYLGKFLLAIFYDPELLHAGCLCLVFKKTEEI